MITLIFFCNLVPPSPPLSHNQTGCGDFKRARKVFVSCDQEVNWTQQCSNLSDLKLFWNFKILFVSIFDIWNWEGNMFRGGLRSHIFRLIPDNPVCILGPWRSKWCFVHNFLPELFFDVFGSRFSFATSTWQPLTFSQYWHSVSWTLTWKRAMPPFQFPLEWLCIDFGTTVNCAKKRFCIWLDHNWSSSFFPNSCFQRSHRYSVEESEGRNDLAVDTNDAVDDIVDGLITFGPNFWTDNPRSDIFRPQSTDKSGL